MILKFHLIWGQEDMLEDRTKASRRKKISLCVWPTKCSCQVKGVVLCELMEKQPWGKTLSWLGIHDRCSHVENDPFKHSVIRSLQIKMQGMGVWAVTHTHNLITIWKQMGGRHFSLKSWPFSLSLFTTVSLWVSQSNPSVICNVYACIIYWVAFSKLINILMAY